MAKPGVDLNQQMKRQLQFLENSCRTYDCDGHLDEAIRMATSLRVLFHTTNSSKSLLSHLATTIELVSTVPAIREHHFVFPLIKWGFIATVDPVFLATPQLDKSGHHRPIPFEEWWDAENILNSGPKVTRRALALWAANKDGGAHVDSSLTDAYQNIIDGLGLAVTAVSDEDDDGNEVPIPIEQRKSSPLRNLHFASLRQMAYEVLISPDIVRFR